MKLPNGYGSVTKLSGNRRRPYMARVCDGDIYDEKLQDFKPRRIVLGYYTTKKEALKALAEYNESPFKLDDNNITFGQIYDRWKKANYPRLSHSSINAREAALKHCAAIVDMKVKDIRTETLQHVLDACQHGSSTKKNIKTVMKTVFDYAMQNNLVNRDYSSYLRIEYTEPVIDREIFTEKEINALWGKSERWDVKVILILLYTGLRVNELLKNTCENVNLEEKWIYVPEELAKNKSSVRYVPIHDRIFPLVKYFYDLGNDKLISKENGVSVPYNNFVTRNLKKINEELGTNHKMHDTRHTFVTLGHKYKLDDLCLKKIVGHTPDNITQKVYTHLTIPELQKEINEIK